MTTRKISNFLLAGIAAITLSSCSGQQGNDYSQVQAQTGGPEQGQWRDKQGTLLDLNSGKFTYQKKGGTALSGTYAVASGKITLTGDGGVNMSATWPDQNGPIMVDGEELTRTD